MINIVETCANARAITMKAFGGAIADLTSIDYRWAEKQGDNFELDIEDPSHNPIFRLGRQIELWGVRLENSTWYKYHSRASQRTQQDQSV